LEAAYFTRTVEVSKFQLPKTFHIYYGNQTNERIFPTFQSDEENVHGKATAAAVDEQINSRFYSAFD